MFLGSFGYNQKTIIFISNLFSLTNSCQYFKVKQEESGSQERRLYELSTICVCCGKKSKTTDDRWNDSVYTEYYEEQRQETNWDYGQ